MNPEQNNGLTEIAQYVLTKPQLLQPLTQFANMMAAIPPYLAKNTDKIQAMCELAKGSIEFIKATQKRHDEAQKFIDLLDDDSLGMSDFAAMEGVPALTVVSIIAMLDDKTMAKAKALIEKKAAKDAIEEIDRDERILLDVIIPRIFKGSVDMRRIELNPDDPMMMGTGFILNVRENRLESNNSYLDTQAKIMIVNALFQVRTAKDYARASDLLNMRVFIDSYKVNIAQATQAFEAECKTTANTKKGGLSSGKARSKTKDLGIQFYKDNKDAYPLKKMAYGDLAKRFGVSEATATDWLANI